MAANAPIPTASVKKSADTANALVANRTGRDGELVTKGIPMRSADHDIRSAGCAA